MATLTIQPSKDNFVIPEYPNNNYGGSIDLTISAGPKYGPYHALLHFLASDIPSGATIVSATLSIYYYSYYVNPGGRRVYAYKLTRNDWTEGDKNGPAGFSNWNYYKDGSAWTTPGGDYVTSSPDGGYADYPASPGWINFDVKEIVEDAMVNVSKNCNFLLKFETESENYYAYHYSREYTGDTSLRPKLVIEYTSGTNMQVNVGGTMKSVSAAQINVGGNWKNVVGKQVNVNNTWKNI